MKNKKNFSCFNADKEALRWVSHNFSKLKSFRLKKFSVDGGSHDIDIEYELRKVK